MRRVLSSIDGVTNVREEKRDAQHSLLIVSYFPSQIGVRDLMSRLEALNIEFKVITEGDRRGESPADVEQKRVLRLFAISILLTAPLIFLMLWMIAYPGTVHFGQNGSALFLTSYRRRVDDEEGGQS